MGRRGVHVEQIEFKIEKGRVLVPVGEPCPFGCKYCYTRGGEVGPPRTSVEEIVRQLETFVCEHEASIQTLQLGYDGDPFARPERGLELLRRLLPFRKNVNFSTKALIVPPTLKQLVAICDAMQQAGCVLSALVSLCCWNSAPEIEPHTPAPQERISTIQNLRAIGVPTLIALRPILPHVSDEEYIQIIEEGLRAGCQGFIPGPLYEDEKKRFTRFIPPAYLHTIPATKSVVSWSAHAPLWTRYEDYTRTNHIASLIRERGGQVFLSSADAMHLFSREEAAV